jgi:hypothetical protein
MGETSRQIFIPVRSSSDLSRHGGRWRVRWIRQALGRSGIGCLWDIEASFLFFPDFFLCLLPAPFILSSVLATVHLFPYMVLLLLMHGAKMCKVSGFSVSVVYASFEVVVGADNAALPSYIQRRMSPQRERLSREV